MKPIRERPEGHSPGLFIFVVPAFPDTLFPIPDTLFHPPVTTMSLKTDFQVRGFTMVSLPSLAASALASFLWLAAKYTVLAG